MVNLTARVRTALGLFEPAPPDPPDPPDPSDEYAWADAVTLTGYTDLWVDPEKITNGDGSINNPFQFSQALSHPSPAAKRFIVMPGQLSVTGFVADDTKMPFLQPINPGTAQFPAILKAQFPATRDSVTESQKTIIRRTANVGSIFGCGPSGPDFWRIDGFKFAGGNGSQGADGGNEKANIVLRGCDDWWLTRIHVDGEEADHVDQGPNTSTNGGAMFLQGIRRVVVKDVHIENMGDHTSAARVWQGIELYDAADCDFSYFTIRNCYGLGFFMKGFGVYAIPFQRNRIHDGICIDCADTCFHPYFVTAGANTADHNYWYNLVADQRGGDWQFRKCVQLNAIDPHEGTHFQNCTFLGGGESLGIQPVNYIGPSLSFHNCIFDQSGVSHITIIGGAPWTTGDIDGIVWDWNQYGSSPVHAQVPDNITYAAWRLSPYSKDANGTNAAPAYVNLAGGDLRANGPNVCPDHWNLFPEETGSLKRGAFRRYGHRVEM